MPSGVDRRSVRVVLQTYLVRWSSDRTVGWGLVGLTVLMGATYAMRDRIKEVFHRWLVRHVYRLYAQRVVRCFMPGSLDSPRQLIVQAREWCNETTTSRPDPLNPESGATLRVTLVNHVHRGVIAPQPQLAASGVRHVRQLFRYDLTPLCTRLHDPIKSIPVSTRGRGGRSLSARRAVTKCQFVFWPPRSRTGEN